MTDSIYRRAVKSYFIVETGIDRIIDSCFILLAKVLKTGCNLFIPAVLFGKRIFCHYLCWMAPFMILGTKLRRFLHLPGIHIRAEKKDNCVSCGKCNRVCPMGIDIMKETKHGIISSQECIQCGACIDNCPKNVLALGLIERKENNNGK